MLKEIDRVLEEANVLLTIKKLPTELAGGCIRPRSNGISQSRSGNFL